MFLSGIVSGAISLDLWQRKRMGNGVWECRGFVLGFVVLDDVMSILFHLKTFAENDIPLKSFSRCLAPVFIMYIFNANVSLPHPPSHPPFGVRRSTDTQSQGQCLTIDGDRSF